MAITAQDIIPNHMSGKDKRKDLIDALSQQKTKPPTNADSDGAFAVNVSAMEGPGQTSSSLQAPQSPLPPPLNPPTQMDGTDGDAKPEASNGNNEGDENGKTMARKRPWPMRKMMMILMMCPSLLSHSPNQGLQAVHQAPVPVQNLKPPSIPLEKLQRNAKAKRAMTR